MKRNAIALPVVATLAFVGLAGILDAAAPSRQAYPLKVTHLHIAVTVWSDGSVDTGPAVILDASNSRRLALRIAGDEEAAARHLERSQVPVEPAAATQGDAAGNPNRCQGQAASTQQRCRLAARSNGFCRHHEPD